MSLLAIYPEDGDQAPKVLRDSAEVAAALAGIGVQLERWAADRPLSSDAGQEEVLETYADAIARLNAHHGFQSVDVVSLRPDNPKAGEMRQKFLSEHTHADFEIRFFVDGRGLFYLHAGGNVYCVLCAQGDLISVPADTTHWFDMGATPDFKCIRFFTTADGWVGRFTGSPIAAQFLDFDRFVELFA
jgi:1,2-dihydroxy-3-keto-5-methylthiopentene dioxygenase